MAKGTDLKETTSNELATEVNAPLGFNDDDADELVVPRVKLIQALSPERKDNSAAEGDLINSLTKDKLNGKRFVPVFMYKNNVLWRDRAQGGGIECMSRNGKYGEGTDGKRIACKVCGKCEFDNTKQGKDAIPTCTKYINFFGFLQGEPMPIILSFGKTNYNEGKKLYSIAKVTMQNMWNNAYVLDSKTVTKSGNEWYVTVAKPDGPTDEEVRAIGMNMYKQYKDFAAQIELDAGEVVESGVYAEVGDAGADTEF